MRGDFRRRFCQDHRFAEPEPLDNSKEPLQKRNAKQLDERVGASARMMSCGRGESMERGERREKVSPPWRVWLP